MNHHNCPRRGSSICSIRFWLRCFFFHSLKHSCMTALHSGSGVGNDRHPIASLKRVYALRLSGNQMTAIGGDPQVARRYGAWPCGAMSAVAQCAGRRNRTKSLATKQVLPVIRFCVNAINAHNESNDGGHISGGWMPAAGSGEKCMRTYSGVPIQ